MKFRITFLIALATLLFAEAQADMVVIISGGGRHTKFHYIYHSEKKIECTGRGSLVCPVTWTAALYKDAVFPIPEIIDFANKQVESGETSGSALYENSVPIKWSSTGDELELTIDAEVTELKHE